MRYTSRDVIQVVNNIVKLPNFFDWRRQPRRRRDDHLTEFSSQIGIGTLFKGVLRGKGNYQIQGEVVGEGNIEGTVALTAGAYWKGNVTADYVRIAGKVDGNVVAHSKIELTQTAVVTGDLSAPLVAMAEGAQYEGAISRPRKTQITRYTERRGQGTATRPS